MNRKNKILLGIAVFTISFMLIYFVSAAETVGTSQPTLCCEKTKSGLFCQDIQKDDCAVGVKTVPTACQSTAFCTSGFCFDSIEGTCLDNTPQMVCNSNQGTWSKNKPAQCELGCCILGDQASFVTLTRCKRLSSLLSLETNYDPSMKSEVQCILTARADEKGACVYEKDFEKTCKFTTRSNCNNDVLSGGSSTSASQTGGTSNVKTNLDLTPATTSGNTAGVPSTQTTSTTTTASGTTTVAGTTNPATTTTGKAISDINGSINSNTTSGSNSKVEFHPRKLCSAEELGTNCGPTKQTICMPGKEEIYFVDTCGNPANIYDSSKINNKQYWANIVDKPQACSPNAANTLSKSCGNCNYLLGSFCRSSSTANGAKAAYGDNICADLNCIDPTGKKRLHGESWCGFDGKSDFSVTKPQAGNIASVLNTFFGSDKAKGQLNGALGQVAMAAGGVDPVGSKFYRYVCVNGEVIVEPCAEFRQEECIQNTIQTSVGAFSQAACRVNRWQDCTTQKNAQDCTNTDRRDCVWLQGIEYMLMGSALNGTPTDGASLAGLQDKIVAEAKANGGVPQGACVPKNAPGLKFWEEGDAKGICAQANAVCPVTYEKGLIGGDWKCVDHCECLEQSTELKRAALCSSLGDCGFKTNIVGQVGAKKGYAIKINSVEADKSSGGLFG
ncbi:MAG: hypothetical protein Q7S74_00185 [Nanoarchaeota archaeon]|nr:hypothetical protein [Nanoarchaeota archaeon]